MTKTVKDILAEVAKIANQPVSKVVEVKGICDILKQAVFDLAKIVEKESEEEKTRTTRIDQQLKDQDARITNLTKQTKEQDDEIDNQIQRRLKGKMVITSNDKGPSPMKSKDAIGEGNNIRKHVVELVKDKYSVTIKEEEMDNCYFLPKGGIVISFWSKVYGSAFQKLATAIKSGKGVVSNLFFNFMLTKKRSKLLFEIRKLKRAQKITKFYIDEEGSISIRLAKNSKSERFTNIRNKDSSYQTILTVDELLHMVQ